MPRFLLLLLLLLFRPSLSEYLFKSTQIAYDQTGAVATGEALAITFAFKPWNFNLTFGDLIYVRMPRFSTSTYAQGSDGGSAGSNIAMGSVQLGPSTIWKASWTEGTWCAGCSNPYNSSLLTLQLRDVNAIVRRTLHTVTVYKSNGIKAYCGHPMNSQKIMIGTNASGTDQYMSVENSPLVGNGCQDKSSCSLHGTCDYCYNTCICDEGYGNPSTEIYDYVRIDCGERTCPAGKSIGSLPTSSTSAHPLKECSDNGICDRQVGQCACFDGWEGLSCDRRVCPNKCSGHGICASMREQSGMSNAFPLSRNVTHRGYGTRPETRNTTAWDADFMYSCVCDSSWPVGLDHGEFQAAEWHGADCSLKRCPGGDDPMTAANETDCNGKQAENSLETGKPGNGCYVECSNRGTCIYEEGVGRCKCFQGFLGEDCGTMSEFGMNLGEWFDPAWDE
mmetsp:Transcript_2728/g.5002  ORF Transcript_2728/g.5002 Transcript_2728/m.5002 type:complete len:448 (-) Transcript_2728:43-1386(-)